MAPKKLVKEPLLSSKLVKESLLSSNATLFMNLAKVAVRQRGLNSWMERISTHLVKHEGNRCEDGQRLWTEKKTAAQERLARLSEQGQKICCRLGLNNFTK